MKNQQELVLTKTVETTTLTLRAINNTTFELSASQGTFTIGKGASYSDGTAINQPEIKGNAVIITKAEIKRLGTYFLYLDGKSMQGLLLSTWVDGKGRNLIFANENDLYYYFTRVDCGIVQEYRHDGSHFATIFHYVLGKTKGSGVDSNKTIVVLEK